METHESVDEFVAKFDILESEVVRLVRCGKMGGNMVTDEDISLVHEPVGEQYLVGLGRSDMVVERKKEMAA